MTDSDWIRIYYEDYIGRNMSLPMLANKYHKGTTTIHRNFTKNGLKCRNHSEKSRKYKCNYNYFDEIDCEEKAYFLGFIYADGYVTGNAFGIALASKDVEIINILLRCMDSTHEIKKYMNNGYGGTYKKTEYVRVIIRNEHLVNTLIQHGVLRKKSKILEPPQIDNKFIRHFIRGYMDGDGSIYQCDNSYTVSFTGTKNMLKYIGDFIENQGIIRRYTLYPEHHSTEIFSLKIGGNIQAKKLLDLLYKESNIYLKRKHDIYLQINN